MPEPGKKAISGLIMVVMLVIALMVMTWPHRRMRHEHRMPANRSLHHLGRDPECRVSGCGQNG